MSSSGSDGERPQHIGFECRVCETRMYARGTHVGRKVKCPDCGAVTVVPRPPKAPSVRTPAALEAEQYEVWPVDQQPTAAELMASQPKTISLECSLCETRLTASADQANELITCPDCGAKTRVPPPDETAARQPWREDDGEELDLEAAEIQPRRPSSTAGLGELDAPPKDAARDAEADSEPTTYFTRPELPRWPLQTKILLFPLSKGVPVRLVLFGLWSAFCVWLVLQGMGFLALPYGAFITMFLLASSVILGIMCISALSACWLAILTESSEGSDVVEAWPDVVFLDWMFEGLYILMAALISGLPGWGVAQLLPEDPQLKAALVAAGGAIFFPIILLSMLDYGSPLAPLSAQVLGSLARVPVSWLAFYLESGLLVAAVAAIGLGLAYWSLLGLTLLAPLVVLASIWYFRLLGRLAWVIAEASPSEE